ncbi:hypothetical protein Ferp_0527 [Ferroglobus placidus DSM 10642]|uniref:Uncharacterized protein n=1 Tax=Ferroglobus placidus (strain DSM 10642 / AEDII12DO) TaxID=589924 RepID=D3S368_FERPA|nr:hypothetical protein [Ferroglobus placidus]ADC64701.1 hypothetical protein Ferp_0527 [Ferroglobus placidus DSM 10642]
MGSVTNTAICPVCGEEYWYDYDTRTGTTTKLSSCACDREIECMREFIRMKGLKDEFREFMREREKEYWHDWIVERGEVAYDVQEFLESLKERIESIQEFLGTDDILHAVAEGLKAVGCGPQELDKVVRELAELLGGSGEAVRKKMLAALL